MKYCTSNGSWFMKEGYEWTDYTPCLDKQVSPLFETSQLTENIEQPCNTSRARFHLTEFHLSGHGFVFFIIHIRLLKKLCQTTK